MADELLDKVLKAESAARAREEQAKKRAEGIIEAARGQAEKLTADTIEQAKSEALLIVSEAEFSAGGIVKQAQKLADMRERKVISETEKRYDEAIKLVLDNIVIPDTGC